MTEAVLVLVAVVVGYVVGLATGYALGQRSPAVVHLEYWTDGEKFAVRGPEGLRVSAPEATEMRVWSDRRGEA